MSKPKSSASGRGKPRRRFPSSAGFKAIPRAERGAPAFGLMGQRLRDNTAAGQAVGNNPISIIIPCHRVVGYGGNLTGYGGGSA